MSTADMTPAQRRAAYTRANSAAIADTAAVLRTVAAHQSYTEPLAGDLGKVQASLLDAVGRHVATLPHEIVTEALAVVTAVDRLTSHRRTAELDGTVRRRSPSQPPAP